MDLKSMDLNGPKLRDANTLRVLELIGSNSGVR